MQSICIITSIILLSLCSILYTGCQQDEGTSPSSTLPTLEDSKKTTSIEVTVGGKVWKIDPNLSYQATGVWTNPSPRLLTDEERELLKTIPIQKKDLSKQLKELRMQLDELDKMQRYLERIEVPEVKVRYNFGKPPYLTPGGIGEIVDLGEFSMKMDLPAKMTIKESE